MNEFMGSNPKRTNQNSNRTEENEIEYLCVYLKYYKRTFIKTNYT